MSDFYIGYLPKMPKALSRYVVPAVAVMFSLAVVLAITFALGQGPFATAFFEFGNVQPFEGTIQAKPVPFLILEKAERSNGLPGLERIALVNEGKFGASASVDEFDGQRVRLEGTLIYRGEIRMIEVKAGSVGRVQGEAFNETEAEKNLGEMTLKGEIIDSKCYLGVMNPGNHKTHRSCAVACLRGGIPPMLLVKDEQGRASELWLVTETGEPINDRILDYVAEPVEVTGRVGRKGDSLFFYAKADSIKRL
ncbi:MAG: hypothetical protein DWQ47_13820 [Acidobacteria bacterium]|nr:MAG: hypothetical protein DWQ32_01220 [Acidobacteriota bacterium]REK02851.1 MAG: hypothetical protein DWQ38_10915 [Acidobacteriota bacterium]REK13345.1 MAG: hypothetical protein DWQ43_06910 [Acidobacteriota bacterium]REK41339.1 MAG: hypothetical protein DWQ47_13820 [Acidobacteriota bacterium]